MRKQPQSNAGSALMIAMIFITVLTMLTGSYLDMIINSNTGTSFINSTSQAFYTAEAGAHALVAQLRSGGASTLSGSLTLSTYTGNYSASYDSGTSVLTSTGTVAGSVATSTRTVTVKLKPIPPYVRGSVTVNGNATVKDNAVADGRDHDSDGNLTGAPGTYGLSSTGTITQSGSSTIGGNGNAPANPAASSAIQENATSFASTEPWDILGVSQAWFNANVTATTTAPTSPFSGIVYYQPSGDWDAPSLDGSTGILIVHNDTSTARLRNFSGTFKGLIIADKLRTETGYGGTIIGAAVVTNAIQNKGGNLTVKYSRSILTDLQSLIAGQTSSWKKVPQDSSWTEAAE